MGPVDQMLTSMLLIPLNRSQFNLRVQTHYLCFYVTLNRPKKQSEQTVPSASLEEPCPRLTSCHWGAFLLSQRPLPMI